MMAIDKIIELLTFAEALGANVTIRKEDVPVLIEALKPVINGRAEYWQRLQARFKRFNVRKK